MTRVDLVILIIFLTVALGQVGALAVVVFDNRNGNGSWGMIPPDLLACVLLFLFSVLCFCCALSSNIVKAAPYVRKTCWHSSLILIPLLDIAMVASAPHR